MFVILFLLLLLFVYVIHLPPLTIAIAILDGTFLGYGAWNAVRIGFFSLHVISMQAFIAQGVVRELNDDIYGAFKTAISKKGLKTTSSLALFSLKQAVARYQREHRHLLEVAVGINNLVASKLMIITFVTNIFTNVIMIAKLIFELPFLSAEAAVVFLIILAQTAISLPACAVQISWTKALYSKRSIHLLFLSQPILKENGILPAQDQTSKPQTRDLFATLMIVAKLKLNLYFELVCTQNQFMFTLGQLGKISKKSDYEVRLLCFY